jgi:hypothetical protein
MRTILRKKESLAQGLDPEVQQEGNIAELDEERGKGKHCP